MSVSVVILLHFFWFACAGIAVCVLSWGVHHAQMMLQTRHQRRRALLELARRLESGAVLSSWKTFASSGHRVGSSGYRVPAGQRAQGCGISPRSAVH